ncbi:MAG: phytoene/squalene synthase family protein [Methylococcales bacterium]
MNGSQKTTKRSSVQDDLTDDQFQSALLEGVSRTFALTIPQLPDALCKAVSNAYLLCRIVDTIEDEVSLSPEQKHDFCLGFIEVVKNHQDSGRFATQLAPLLSKQTIPAEHELIRDIPQVVRITHSFHPDQQEALICCVETMAHGMPKFQETNLKHGLVNLEEHNKYCYYVAGCVGEMLAKLFCHYSPEIAKHRSELLKLSVSFGQGLQMTNILKDIWDDSQRGVCWLPRDIFTKAGFNLDNLASGPQDPAFQEGLKYLISIAHGHLTNALKYTLLIPKKETGIRYFCLWALGMAVLTLKKIRGNLDFSDSSQVKISRKQVKATILATRLTARSNLALRLLFKTSSTGLSLPQWSAQRLEPNRYC